MRFPLRTIARTFTLTAVICASTAVLGQQPTVNHAQLTTQAADHGLSAALDTLKRQNAPLWAAYAIPVSDGLSSGWRSNGVEYLEEDHHSDGNDGNESRSFDHAVILLRLDNGAVTKLRVESPDRQLDAGGLRFVWLTGVTPDDSVHTLAALAEQQDASKQLRDGVIFAISIHQTAAATQALISLAAPANPLDLREKAAFWLANQRGHDGLVAIQRFAHDDADPNFREKLTFDLTLSKDPAALNELIRMAHEDASPKVRKQAQFWMATKGGKLVAGDLRNAAENDPDTQVRKSAVFALSRLPSDEATTQLIQVADTSKDPAVRKQAVFWLGQSSDPRALDYLTKLLKQ
jgi:HEAT repeat protein